MGHIFAGGLSGSCLVSNGGMVVIWGGMAVVRRIVNRSGLGWVVKNWGIHCW